jgi:dsDNA-specific endonuclease/ATPase MutS2
LLNLNSVIFIDNLPKLDLHGYDRDYAKMKINEYINDNIVLKINIFIIVHGNGQGILRNTTHKTLSTNKNVIGYKLYNCNNGCTIVEIRI